MKTFSFVSLCIFICISGCCKESVIQPEQPAEYPGDPLDLDDKQQEFIRAEIEKFYKGYIWETPEYTLRLMDDWDNRRLPILIADPKGKKNLHFSSFIYALLPDRRVVSARQKEALSQIVRQVFVEIHPSDAVVLARLAVMFGHFEEPIGSLYSPVPGENLPRKNPQPEYEKQGQVHIVKFYTFTFEGPSRLYDCALRITVDGIALSSRLVTE